MRRRSALLLSSLVALLTAPSAFAATARVAGECDKYGCNDFVVYEAAPGERNRVTTEVSGPSLIIRDAGASLTAGHSCTPISGGVSCVTYHYAGVVPGMRAYLGDGDDEMTAGGDLSGGAGNDRLTGNGTLRGGPGDDVLTGSGNFWDDDGAVPGHDVYRGTGGGYNQLFYSARKDDIRVDLRPGSRSEDRISGMQAVTGGRGDDVIIGDDNANHLDGAEGRDRLVGLGGDDILSNTYVWRRSGDDVLDAGPGNDQLNGAASASQLRCGPGEDSVSASVGNLVGRDCELVGSDSWPKTRLRATVSNATTVFLGSLPYCQDCSSDRWRVEARGRVVASVSARTQPADLRLNATGRRLLRRYRALTLRVERRFVLPPRTTRSMSGFTTTIRLR